MQWTAHTTDRIPPGRLRFGAVASAAAWVVHGLSSVFISWQACQDGDDDWGALSGGEVRTLLFVTTALLLAVALSGGLTSFANWRHANDRRSPGDIHARDPVEMLSFAGVFIGTTFAIAILWAAVPLFVLGVCVSGR